MTKYVVTVCSECSEYIIQEEGTESDHPVCNRLDCFLLATKSKDFTQSSEETKNFIENYKEQDHFKEIAEKSRKKDQEEYEI